MELTRNVRTAYDKRAMLGFLAEVRRLSVRGPSGDGKKGALHRRAKEYGLPYCTIVVSVLFDMGLVTGKQGTRRWGAIAPNLDMARDIVELVWLRATAMNAPEKSTRERCWELYDKRTALCRKRYVETAGNPAQLLARYGGNAETTFTEVDGATYCTITFPIG